jgi:hypothetical protein
MTEARGPFACGAAVVVSVCARRVLEAAVVCVVAAGLLATLEVVVELPPSCQRQRQGNERERERAQHPGKSFQVDEWVDRHVVPWFV